MARRSEPQLPAMHATPLRGRAVSEQQKNKGVVSPANDGKASRILAKARQAPRFRLLPLTIIMACLVLCVKATQLFQEGNSLYQMIYVPEAFAEDEAEKPADATKEQAEAEKPGEEAPADSSAKEGEPPATTQNAASDAKPEDAAEKSSEKTADNTGEKTEDTAAKSGETEVAKLEDAAADTGETNKMRREFSQIEVDLLQSLAQRREELEAQGAEMELKQTVLESTEVRINDKLEQMKALQGEVQTLLDQYNNLEKTQIESMVKIYENMKPKDASQIFNGLDMPILLEIVDEMSERKVAPILAGMDPLKAQELTVELSEYRKLNKVPNTIQ